MLKHYIATTIHKAWVFYFILGFCFKLLRRAITHDLSKYYGLESKLLSQYSNISKDLEYGSLEYEEVTKLLAPALEIHYKKNRHHIQHHKNGIHDFTLVDLVELFCDNCAAVKRQKTGNIDKSIDICERKFNIDHQIAEILHNQVHEDDK